MGPILTPKEAEAYRKARALIEGVGGTVQFVNFHNGLIGVYGHPKNGRITVKRYGAAPSFHDPRPNCEASETFVTMGAFDSVYWEGKS